MSLIQNPNCDGDFCSKSTGEVRVMPLGGGGNLILCRTCFAHENAYRRLRGNETGEPGNWPQVDWKSAKVYSTESTTANIVVKLRKSDFRAANEMFAKLMQEKVNHMLMEERRHLLKEVYVVSYPGKQDIEIWTASSEYDAMKMAAKLWGFPDGPHTGASFVQSAPGSKMTARLKEGYTKKALIRDPKTPVGQPGDMSLTCTCGNKVDVGEDGGECNKCGQKYNASGWLIENRYGRDLSNAAKAKAKAAADPNCKECGGDGYVEVTYNNDPDRDDVEPCKCTDDVLYDLHEASGPRYVPVRVGKFIGMYGKNDPLAWAIADRQNANRTDSEKFDSQTDAQAAADKMNAGINEASGDSDGTEDEYDRQQSNAHRAEYDTDPEANNTRRRRFIKKYGNTGGSMASRGYASGGSREERRQMGITETTLTEGRKWANKENRDKAFIEAGGTAAGLKKTSTRNQLINPKYVEDSGVSGPTKFGDDTEMFSVLYSFVKVMGESRKSFQQFVIEGPFPPCDKCGGSVSFTGTCTKCGHKAGGSIDKPEYDKVKKVTEDWTNPNPKVDDVKPGRKVDFEGDLCTVVSTNYKYSRSRGEDVTMVTLRDDDGKEFDVTLDELVGQSRRRPVTEDRDYTPRYTVQIFSPGYSYTEAAWEIKQRFGQNKGKMAAGKPTDDNLRAYITKFEDSCEPGGVNDHLGERKITRAFIKDQQTGDIVATYHSAVVKEARVRIVPAIERGEVILMEATKDFDKYGYFHGTIPQEAVDDCTGPGPADESVEYWQKKLNFNVPRDLAIRYLREFGAWEQGALKDMSDLDLAQKVLWIACGDLKEQGEWFGLVH
jgi:hypothetical protein